MTGLKNFWKRLNLKLCRGGTRYCLLIGPYAIKVPRIDNRSLFRQGLSGNQNEQRFTRRNYSRILPVTWSSPWGVVSIMPRADTASITLDDVHNWIITIGELPHADVLSMFVEVKPSSLGRYKQQIVAIDYGHQKPEMFKYRSS